ncbi:MAG: NAD(P)/FAD-dependent oxidoreductase [Saprospiraceae bacterium]|nr:NAD(P)/FAD-dependent oxidoreductase [Saprospiraceae bacterium]
MHTVIIGNGVSGITAARTLRKLSDQRITVISYETEHFFSRTALMYVYMGHMRFEDIKPYEDWFWEKNKIDLIKDRVTSIDFESKSLRLDATGELSYDSLILALGSKGNRFGWPGQDLQGVSGLYHVQDLERMEQHSPGLERAVVVGGGLIGIEMAEMFASRDIDVTFLVRETNYWNNVLPEEESQMISDHIREHHFDLRLGVNLGEIIDNGQGQVGGVVIKESGEKIPCGFVGLTPGVSPNIGWLKEGPLETNRGILVNAHLETNQPDVYAIGDCAEITEPRPGRRPIEAVWYTGRMMGETVAHTLAGNRTAYDPGIWFNSAKFLDIEYQVYGDVPARPGEEIGQYFWKGPDGRKSFRILFHKEHGHVTGFNLLGIRFRHEVCEKWLRDQTPVDQVMSNLALANFDPEFYRMHEEEIVAGYNAALGRQVRHRAKRNLNHVLKFLKSK